MHLLNKKNELKNNTMTSKITLLVLFVISMFIMGFRYESKKKKILFFGDSITQMGVQPGGYIAMIDEFIKNEGLSEKYETIGAGISGNKVYDLYFRLEDDVLAKSPDIVIIYIGINDIWHKKLSQTGTDYDKFGKFYEGIVKKLRANNIKVILSTPAVIGEKADGTNEMDNDLNLYCLWIKTFAEKNNLPFVNLRHAFYEYENVNNTENKESGILTADKVHLNAKGNELVAKEFWKAIKEVR